MQIWRILFFLIVIAGSGCQAETTLRKGIYFSYEGAEYENTFIECQSEKVWVLTGDEELLRLQSRYNGSEKSKYGEIYIEIVGSYTPVDKSSFPQSHYDGFFLLKKLEKLSTDPSIIEDCRKDTDQ